MSIITIGIDPGKSGALVVLRDGRSALLRRIAPVVDVGKRGKSKIEYDDKGMFEALQAACNCGRPSLVILEQQQARPQRKVKVSRGGEDTEVSVGQGATSNFTTGVGFGLWRMALVALGVPFQIVHPSTWTKVMLDGVPGEGKARNIIAVKRQLPELSLLADTGAGGKSDRVRKDHDGLADAGLLALYAYRKAVKR